MSSLPVWNVHSTVSCKSGRVPSRKSVYFGISKLILYFPDNFHVPCTWLFTVYVHVPCTVHFTVYFHSLISTFLFFCYWSHSKASAVNQTIHLCFYQRFTISQSFKRTSCNGWKWIATLTYNKFQNWHFFSLRSKMYWNVNKPIKRYLQWRTFFRQNCRLRVCNFTKKCSSTSIFHNFCSNL